MKTVMPKLKNINRKWYLVNAEGIVLGRLASQVAAILRGKHKAEFVPHLDLGDHVVVVNAEKIRTTGKKLREKRYTRYTGYPGGLRYTPLEKALQDKPEWVIIHAVRGMLPHNSLGRQMLRKLKVYKEQEHPHQAQRPEPLTL